LDGEHLTEPEILGLFQLLLIAGSETTTNLLNNALPDLLERLQGLELASREPWEPRQALHVHGPARLAVRFNPGRRAAAQA
jgi:cytochrome P450